MCQAQLRIVGTLVNKNNLPLHQEKKNDNKRKHKYQFLLFGIPFSIFPF